MSRAFKIHAADNVATLLADVSAGAAVHVLGESTRNLVARDQIMLGHKLALTPIGAGETVIKFGVAIGCATRDIAEGEWVHLHNLASAFDHRSKTLDVETGAATDTKYE